MRLRKFPQESCQHSQTGAYDEKVLNGMCIAASESTREDNPDNRSEGNAMKKIENVLDKRVSVRSLGNFIGGSLLVAIVAGVFHHRRAIKRLIEIQRM